MKMLGDIVSSGFNAVVINLAILAIWYIAEYAQYGKLYWNRKCDIIVFLLYITLTWYLFYKVG